MKYIENYKPFIFKPKTGTFWFIKGDANEVSDILKELSNNFLSADNAENMKKMISRIDDYLNVKSVGFFIYYSRFGFSYSIIEDLNQMLDLYKSHKEANIYKYIGELSIVENQIIFDNKNKDFLEDTIRYNL